MGDDDERSEFERAMRGARRLRDRNAVRPPAAPKPRPAAPRGEETGPALEILRTGEEVEGRAPGVDARTLRRLRRGEIAPELRVDLHGLYSASAERALADAFGRSTTEGMRCVLVIHGRGLHSDESGPVLKDAFLEWIARPPFGARVLAVASAPPRLGGPGATLVMLRRARGAGPARRDGSSAP